MLGQVFPLVEDRGVDLAGVEREICRIWSRNADKDDPKAAATQVCILNLVAVALDCRSASRASEVGASITGRYPCRVIIAAGDAAGPDEIEASVSAYCHPGGPDGKPICCERINLHASGTCVRQLAFAVTPLLAPDVPVFVWWQGDPEACGDLFARMVDHADRLIVDLQTITQPARFLPELVRFHGMTSPDVTDMAWRRTAQWRDLVASLFDPPAFHAEIGRLKELRVNYVPGGGSWPQAQAALVGVWICERLGWQPDGRFDQQGETWTLAVTTPSGAGKVTLMAEAGRETAPGEITSVLFPPTDSCALSFGVRREGDGDWMDGKTGRPNEEPLTWRRPHAACDTAHLLGEELERPHGSPAFARALGVLAGVV